ncbi:MAG: SPOR domain-containing protein [Flavobacteriales bacterium]|nr:SPOR domain-containing protein [Flavobacteriales bacterium]
MVLERTIHDLLYGHDCVIVPGFGGFLTHYRSARLDLRQRMISPPGKDLSFNRNLVRNDGLLADRVAHLDGLGLAQANSSIEAIVQGWRQRLDVEGRLELVQLGTFFLDAERNLQFEPDRHVNHLKDAYGLRPVAAVPLIKPVVVPAPKVIELPLVPAEEVQEERRSNVLWAAAAFTALLFAAGTWVMVGRNGDQAQWSGLNLFGPQEDVAYAPRTEQPIEPEAADEQAFQLPDTGHGVQAFPVAGDGSPEVVVDLGPAPVVAESTAVAVRTEVMHYHVIGGCFSMKENADHYIAELASKGFSPVLVDRKGGLYRVALGSYPEKGMALEALSAARQQQAPEAWLLVK